VAPPRDLSSRTRGRQAHLRRPFFEGCTPTCPRTSRRPERFDHHSAHARHADHVGATVASRNRTTASSSRSSSSEVARKKPGSESECARYEKGRHGRRGRREDHGDETRYIRVRAGRLYAGDRCGGSWEDTMTGATSISPATPAVRRHAVIPCRYTADVAISRYGDPYRWDRSMATCTRVDRRKRCVAVPRRHLPSYGNGEETRRSHGGSRCRHIQPASRTV